MDGSRCLKYCTLLICVKGMGWFKGNCRHSWNILRYHSQHVNFEILKLHVIAKIFHNTAYDFQEMNQGSCRLSKFTENPNWWQQLM